MSAQAVVTETANGWDVHVTEAKDVVVRLFDNRITVAMIPDDDDTPTPLAVTLAPESVTSA